MIAGGILGFDVVYNWCQRTFGLFGMCFATLLLILLIAGMAKADREYKDYEGK
jgi:hypothetical protein